MPVICSSIIMYSTSRISVTFAELTGGCFNAIDRVELVDGTSVVVKFAPPVGHVKWTNERLQEVLSRRP